MTLETQVLQFPLAGGLNEGTDPRYAPPGTLNLAVNCQWTKDGRLDKRFGTASLGSASASKRLFARKGELCATDGASLFSYSATLGSWTNVGSVPETSLTSSTLLDALDGVQSSDVCQLTSGLIVQAWVAGDPLATGKTAAWSTGLISWQKVDPTSGAVITPPTLLEPVAKGFACSVKLLTDGTHFALVWTDDGGKLYFSYDGGAPTTLKSDLFAAVSTFDVCMIGTTSFIVVYERSSGASSVVALEKYSFAASPAGSASGTVSGETGLGTTTRSFYGMAIAGATAETVYVGYIGTSSAGAGHRACVAGFDTSLTQTVSRTTVSTASTNYHFEYGGNVGICRLDATHCVFAYSIEASSGTAYRSGAAIHVVISSVGAVSATLTRTSHSTRFTSKPFMVGSKVYALATDYVQSSSYGPYGFGTYPTLPGPNTYLLELEQTAEAAGTVLPHRYLGSVDILIGGGWGAGHLTNAATSATGAVALAPFLADAPTNAALSWRQGVRRVNVAIGTALPLDQYRAVEISGESYLVGSFLTAYDGRRPFDFGFPRPSLIDTQQSAMAGSGGSQTAGVHYYATVPVFHSAQGILHRGASSPSLPFTAASSDKMALYIIPQTQGWKGALSTSVVGGVAWQEPLRVVNEVYRTVAAGSNLQKLTIEPTFSVKYNDASTTVPNLLSDALSDTSIDSTAVDGSGGSGVVLSARPVIYSAGELDDYAPPSPVLLHVHKGRMWVVSGDKRTLWVSKSFLANPNVAPGFHPTQILIFDEDITGLASCDGTLIVFSALSIWVIAGEGPAPDGSGSDYNPTRIQTDAGCSTARSIVSFPDGVLFANALGIYKMSRGLEVSWLGKRVQDQLTTYPAITSATLVPTTGQVRFTCVDSLSAPTAGIALVYDYVRDQWVTFKYKDGATYPAPIMDACIWNGVWAFVCASGTVYKEDASTYLDAGTTWVTADWETMEIYGDGPLSSSRIRRSYILGARLTDADVTLSLAFDGASTYAQTATWTSDELYALGSAAIGVHVSRQKAESMRLRYTDATPTGSVHHTVGTGRGMSISAVSFEVGNKRGSEKRPATARK